MSLETFTITEDKESTATSKELIEAEIKKSKHELEELQQSTISDFVDESKENEQGHIGEAKKYLEYVKDRPRNQLRNDYATMQAVQLALTKLGYDSGKIDGLLGKEGSATRKAVEKFQKENGLTEDGLPGFGTIQKILDLLPDSPEQLAMKKYKKELAQGTEYITSFPTAEVAKDLVNKTNGGLYLDGLTSIDKDIATELAKLPKIN